MIFVCFDLEGVLVPEIWIGLAERTGIDELRRTTRDEPDYDVLMNYRIALLEKHGLGIGELNETISGMNPLPGAADFLRRVREKYQVAILSDTFYEFANPLMRQLDWPTLFCHHLEVSPEGKLTGYRLRSPDGKREVVQALKGLGHRVIAVGDSYNDTRMLGEADQGILFHAPDNVIKEFPQFPRAEEYSPLLQIIDEFAAN